MVRPDINTLQKTVKYAEDVVDSGIDTSNAKALVKMRNSLIRLENLAKEARKRVIEPALDDEIDVGDRVADLQRLQAERRTVKDTTAALEMLEEAGTDPAGVVNIPVGQFTDAVEGAGIDTSAVIDEEEYTYYRRDG